jgi:hypothetical protein
MHCLGFIPEHQKKGGGGEPLGKVTVNFEISPNKKKKKCH